MFQSATFNDRFEYLIQSVQDKMQRSASFANVKIDFNPLEVKVGHSSIDKLPIRKCSSQKSFVHLHQMAQNQEKVTLQNQQIKIDMLKRINESLQRENSYLKKQLDYLTQACSSRRNSITAVTTASNAKKQATYKEKLLSRIDSKVERDKNDTESTGLFNSKLSHESRKSDHIQDTISEVYDKLGSKGFAIKGDLLNSIVQKFMENLLQTSDKLKGIYNVLNKKGEKLLSETHQIIGILSTVGVYGRNPKLGVSLMKQTEAQIRKKMTMTREQRINNVMKDFITTNDIVALFQIVSKTVLNSQKAISIVKNSVNFARFTKIVSKIQ